MLVVGITGGIGCGKSTVVNIIRQNGYSVISSDEIAKELMTIKPEIVSKIKALFGEEAYMPNGEPNRSLIADKVFGDSDEHALSLKNLDSIVHPPVIDVILKQIDEYEKLGEECVFVESALIYEAGIDDGFDYIIAITAKEDTVLNRLGKRPGLTREKVLNRIRSQMPVVEKVGLADFAIENDGSLDKLKQSVDFVIGIIDGLIKS
jgi:dephospho-CoA kinase